MQSQTQAHTESNPATTSTSEQQLNTAAQPQQSESDAQSQENKSAETETSVIQEKCQTGEQNAEIPANMDVTEQVESQPGLQSQTESCKNTGKMDGDSTAMPSAPTERTPETNTNPSSNGQKGKKQDKGVSDGRKYVPSKKAMIDPLKMDMSKPLVIPLTSSQLSLQCIECHIIFSDHKSKERHLKLSHPAEYEQCILRNALFTCYVCDRHFTNSTELMAHQKAHIEKKPFKCPICGLAYKKSSELTVHKKIHFGQDGYACTDCGKTCKTLTLLRYHQRTHTGERPYVCKECGKRFTVSKALQKHTAAHLQEGEAQGGTAKKELKKNDGTSTTRYPCSLCKATFKSLKTRLHHMKTKHNNAASNVLPAGQLVKQSAPIITPISISQPALLQVEPNGPLQKVDANIDTEQIRKLIESLGNVRKVNQVVILGQVPPHAPPLQVQQVSQPLEPVNLNLTPPQIDFIGLKQMDSKDAELDPLNNQCDPMEQTIILEPITPDGQLENPSFSGLGPHVAPGENIELTLVEAEQTERPEGEAMPLIFPQPEISAVHSDLMVCQNEVENLKEHLEQTVILELTPALIPILELEQSQTEPQNEIASSSLVLNTDQETPAQTADQTVIDERETSLAVPSLMPTVELELTSLHPEQQDLSSYPFAPPDALTQAPSKSDTNSKEDIESRVKTVGVDQVPEMDEKTQGQDEQHLPEKLPIDGKNNPSEVEEPSAKTEGHSPSQLQTKQVPQNELPISVMSAQELVKVRKRKPARTFIFQGYMQDFVGSIYKDDFQINATPAKRQRAKKSHLVVKFGPQSKDKKTKKQKKPAQKGQPIQSKTSPKKLSEKKVPLQNKGGKGKKNKTKGNVVSGADNKSPSTQAPQVQQIKEDKGNSKIKKQKVAKEGVAHISEHKSFASPMFKKKKQAKILQKNQPKSVKGGKAKKNLARDEKVKKANAPGPHITQDSLLLLKGHKQPQLKVYKLDPSKAPSQTPEASPNESQTICHHSTTESTNDLSLDGKKKGGKAKKNQKALSLLSSLKVSHQPSETLPTKPKTTRKRKSSSKVETEGIITSKRALECKDCGERFSEVSSLQKHKTSAHIVESPSLTYTNGNIFEGVSRLDLYQLPKTQEKVVHAMNAATDWDIEPETGEMALEDRERSVSFPALIPSPSLQIPPQDVEMSSYEDKDGSKTGADIQSDACTEVPMPSDEVKSTETCQNVTPEAPSLTSTQTKSSETEGPLISDEEKQEEDATNTPGSESEVQGTKDEDVKEDLLLEVDLITVGEQNERDDLVSIAATVPQNESDRSCEFESGSIDKHTEQVSDGTTERSLTSQTVSCSTHQVEVKEEEEETVVQKRKEGGKGVVRNAPRGRRRGPVHLKRDSTSKRSSVQEALRGAESENEHEDCQVVYEKHPLSSEMTDRETNKKSQTSPEFEAIKSPGTSLPSIPSALEESNGEPVVFELASLTTSVEEVMNERGLEGGEENDRETDQSPGIILERFLTSRQSATTDKEMCLISVKSNQKRCLDRVAENDQGIRVKVEESSSDPLLVASTCQNRQRDITAPQHHRDIRTILVKEESSSMLNDAQVVQQGSKRMQWNLEPVSNENTDIPLMECEETTRGCRISPEFSTNQCIFYPVKEEEREVLLGAAQNNRGSTTPEGPSDANQSEPQTADCDTCEGRHSAPDYQETLGRGLLSEPGVGDFAEGQAAASDSEWQNPSDLRDFLLRSSDEEDASGFQLSEPHLDMEAEALAYFNKNQTSSPQQPDQTSPNVPTSSSWLLAPRQENRTRKPIDYFSKYFGWDTWVEIATCTNKLSSMPNPVTCEEVARFVGIHIAMGTLKFPSPRLYWEDFTKVPLIAEAISRTRFLELSRTLRLNSPSENPGSSSTNSQQEGKACSSSQGIIPQHDDGQCQGSNANSSAQTDPLWKVRPLLNRFNAGCHSLKQHGDYAVDQYSLPLTGKICDNRPSLLCITLIGFDGLLSHVDLKLDLSDKEDAIEKMAPRGSMVFLCKQELSTPAMLERLLVAGVHGAGRVGGARGQIGDEFVSSDGKLMLRRSHCGFILSTAGNSQRNVTMLMESFETAQMSARLNRDLLNLYSIPLMASAPTCWPQAVLWYLIDTALVNSWLLYCQDNRGMSAPLSLMAFRLEVSKALILSSGSDAQDSVPPQPPSEEAHATSETPNPILMEENPLPDAATRYDGSGHWPEQLTEGEGGRCRFGDCQRTSRVLCLKCCVFLCISRNHNCFLNFHNQGSLGKE